MHIKGITLKHEGYMTIVEALQRKNNRLRISDGHRWLYWDEDDGWVVAERKYNAKKTTIICQTEDENKAVEELLKSYG